MEVSGRVTDAGSGALPLRRMMVSTGGCRTRAPRVHSRRSPCSGPGRLTEVGSAGCLTKQFALCLKNSGNEASLILGKVYRIIPDRRAARDGLVRIIDESGHRAS
jgi:hypothetical protein